MALTSHPPPKRPLAYGATCDLRFATCDLSRVTCDPWLTSCAREIDEADVASLERRLRQATEMTVGKKKRILLARMDLERTHGQLLEVGNSSVLYC